MASEQTNLELVKVVSILETIKTSLSYNTLRAYQSDIAIFADWMNQEVPVAIGAFLGQGPAQAAMLADNFRCHLIDKGNAAATINRRLASLRKILKFAKRYGLVGWSIEIPGIPAQPYRNTVGPNTNEYLAIVNTCETSTKDIRDCAILHLLFDLGLRRFEVARLTLEAIQGSELVVLGKGYREHKFNLPEPTRAALDAWLSVRPPGPPGPLFLTLARNRAGQPLSPEAIWRMVKARASRAEVRATPHALRHSAITQAYQATGNLASTSRFARHSNVATTMLYVDNLTREESQVAKALTDRVYGKELKED